MFNNVLKGLDAEMLLLLFKEAYIHAERKGINIDEIEKQKPNKFRHWGCFNINLEDFWTVFDKRYRNPYGFFTEEDAVAVLDWIADELRDEEWGESIRNGTENYILDSDRLAFCDCRVIVGLEYPYCEICQAYER